ncbi:ATP-binding cassette domain-containing protein [Lysobacter sp. HDW10]|uniref:ABC transporter ATP-binding protein n=1 Tax=Lysobacter sp. HDW10 TaxID=2714936 RepID=UPI001F10DC2F|nr:ATP-binding cassette domain-containing protein [Lysobacter sp. HDW10]
MPTSRSPAIAVDVSALQLVRDGHVVLDGVEIQVPTGSVTAVLGPSGSGKSTLLAALMGELAPAKGAVKVFGETVPAGKTRALLTLRKQMGVLLQGNGLLSDLTAAENVALPIQTHTALPKAVIERLVELKLHAVGLRGLKDAFPRELSGGQARRVALARALALDPPLMIYDEPLTGLDPIAAGVITELMGRLNKTLGLTSVIVTHHVHETLPICDHAVVIANGQVVFQGTPSELNASRDPWVRQFLDGAADGPIAFDAQPRTYA